MAEIAFIGLGVMGGAMARHLVDKGHDVAVYDIAPGARDGFRNLKCRVAESPADAAAGARVLMTMLPEGAHVRSVLFGEDGAARTLAANALVIEMSTIDALTSLAIAADLAAMGLRMIDAPVGRTPEHARAGKLLVMAGGSDADLAEARPLFACFADEIVHIGPLGHGIKMKLVNNYMSMVGMVMTAEALTLARKVGLDRDTAVKVIQGTVAGRGQINTNFPNKVLKGDITPDFPLRMGLKDLSLALALGASAGSPLPLGSAARELYALARSWGRSEQDCTAMLLLIEDIARCGGE
ncbi:MAG: NAD-binding protein [Hyphomicrobiaceae bacterium]|nr:NAD-binding protein [Hyphomicrobiaceae bacterium]